MAHAAEIGGVVGENLRNTLDWLPKARELVTIKCDVELPVAIEELAHDKHNEAKLAELFDRFEFKTWRRELQEAHRGRGAGGAGIRRPWKTSGRAAVAKSPRANTKRY